MHRASEGGHAEIVKLLIDAGAPVNGKNQVIMLLCQWNNLIDYILYVKNSFLILLCTLHLLKDTLKLLKFYYLWAKLELMLPMRSVHATTELISLKCVLVQAFFTILWTYLVVLYYDITGCRNARLRCMKHQKEDELKS